MSDQHDGEGQEPQDFEAFMREFLEKGSDGMDLEKLAKVAGLPNDPAQIAAMLSQLRGALNKMSAEGGGVNFKMTED